MNSEFHYYSTAFLAVKAGFSRAEATTLAYAGQYVDHHHRELRISTSRGTVAARPTQNFSFWDQETVAEVLAPFHFLPAGKAGDEGPYRSVRADGATSVWDVRPNSPPAKRLLVAALKSRDLYRIGLALHTFSDTWAHQNFTARNEDWNRFVPGRLPSPGHAAAGFVPDLWQGVWDDPRLRETRVVNRDRFSDCARKVYRYLCTFKGKDFRLDEEAVSAGLLALVDAGRGREAVEDRVIEYVLALDLEPYDKAAWLSQALEDPEVTNTDWTVLDRWKKVGEDLLGRAGLVPPLAVRARKNFEDSPLAAWIRAADQHRDLAKDLIREATAVNI